LAGSKVRKELLQSRPLIMDEQFAKVKTGGGGLRLKGEKPKKQKKQKKSRKREHEGEDSSGREEEKRRKKEYRADSERHGGWWAAQKYHEVSGPVAIQFPNNCYMKAMDNGKFVLGAPHADGEGPDPEEILMAMKVGGCEGDKVSLKSGFDRFLRLNKQDQLHGVSEAVGTLEQFQPVWQDGQCALLGPNNKFVTADEDDLIVCTQLAVGEGEIIRIRSNKEKEDVNKKVIPVEERGSAADVELKFTKKFMKFQDHKYKARLDYESQGQILVAKDQGNLHETLLDRREKLKSDRMCK